MIYALKDLLLKMGAPDAAEKGAAEWFYFDKNQNDLLGFAGLRFEAGGERMIAELKHIRENYEDDDGIIHAHHTDHFHMAAERTARPGHYRVTSITFDGTHYDKPTAAIIELGLGIFHAKALDISIAMVEQSLTKQDMLQKHDEAAKLFRDFMGHEKQVTGHKMTPRQFRQRQFAVKAGKTPKKPTPGKEPVVQQGAVILAFPGRQKLSRRA